MATGKWTTSQIPPQDGKTALITGANSGIGYQAAVELARRGAHVVLGVRDRNKGEAALVNLRAQAPGANAKIAMLDMASLVSIRNFARTFDRPLDILINNAGVMARPTREVTTNGFERQFGTNHLGHFALTGLLLPNLLQVTAPRVVTVSSLAHRNGKIDFNDLQSEKHYVPWTAYNQSKLANLLFALELDRHARAAGSRLRSIPVHPGVSRTNLFAHGSGPKKLALTIFGPILMQSDKAGAWPLLYGATAPEAQGGVYIGPDGFMAFKGSPTIEVPRPQALDEAVAKRLWTVSEELTGVVYPPLT